MQKMTEKFLLHASEIGRFSQLTVHLLQQVKINPRDILRFRLSIENVMEIWMHELGENTNLPLPVALNSAEPIFFYLLKEKL